MPNLFLGNLNLLSSSCKFVFSVCCAHLAGKSEERPIDLANMLLSLQRSRWFRLHKSMKSAQPCSQEFIAHEMPNLKKQVIDCEIPLLRALQFSLRIVHPFHRLRCLLADGTRGEQGKLRLVTQIAREAVLSLYSTEATLMFGPSQLAKAMAEQVCTSFTWTCECTQTLNILFFAVVRFSCFSFLHSVALTLRQSARSRPFFKSSLRKRSSVRVVVARSTAARAVVNQAAVQRAST